MKPKEYMGVIQIEAQVYTTLAQHREARSFNASLMRQLLHGLAAWAMGSNMRCLSICLRASVPWLVPLKQL